MALTLRQEIAEALRAGFGEGCAHVRETPEVTEVHTTYCREPILVWPDGVEVPASYADEVRRGIALDVAAILAVDSLAADAEVGAD